MGITSSVTHTQEPIPRWIYTVKVKDEYAVDKFDAFSEGMSHVTPTTMTRSRPGKFDTDAARWSRGFTTGKHVFEIVYPTAHRGSEAPVGVGLKSAPLHSKGRVTLIGHNRESWGIDLRSRRAYHNNKVVKKYPQSQQILPDKIFMYLDVDSGTLQFGSDERYYGTAITGIRTDGEPLYPMIGSCLHGSTISMVYRGEAADDLTTVTTTTTVVVNQQTQMQPDPCFQTMAVPPPQPMDQSQPPVEQQQQQHAMPPPQESTEQHLQPTAPPQESTDQPQEDTTHPEESKDQPQQDTTHPKEPTDQPPQATTQPQEPTDQPSVAAVPPPSPVYDAPPQPDIYSS
ncbi:uncharacterized protein LOC124134676 [Haliotis rufescens]|uniref:uncharacterized protein LOC124134676 n=1 Tax=Haliotis rufescens TaxID=6454 RepID=UPI00201F0585|nr:uncharacterized protein LOC124134676 [Haliotis rufescens]XP_046355583.2 uncharacterized protein LOC124134676 [Haliotis rufescens]